MNLVRLILILLLIQNISFGQEIPQVKFNHLLFVIDTDDMLAIRNSAYIKDELTALKIRTTKADENDSWTGTYMYGNENYIELFDTLSSSFGLPIGVSGYAFSVDNIGELNILGESLSKSYKIEFGERKKDFNGQKIPWFSHIDIVDSTFYKKTKFWFWIMEYKKEYFDFKHYSYTDNSLTREAYLKEKEQDRANKIIKRFSGVVMKLSEYEREYLSKFFDHVGYQKVGENEYWTPDRFRFLFKDRKTTEKNTIESIEFETTKRVEAQVVKISDKVLIEIAGKKGRFLFE